MLWYLLAALVAVAALALLAVALLSAWRDVKGLTAAVGRAGEAVAGVQGELEAGLAELQARAPQPAAARRTPPAHGDGAALARRVRASRL
ncbi:MAG TPA: hypothetical protein VNU26_13940 [Mycobacteriales bacterium]|nr:hypothetical protein [Mycobacteriales bacterium]